MTWEPVYLLLLLIPSLACSAGYPDRWQGNNSIPHQQFLDERSRVAWRQALTGPRREGKRCTQHRTDDIRLNCTVVNNSGYLCGAWKRANGLACTAITLLTHRHCACLFAGQDGLSSFSISFNVWQQLDVDSSQAHVIRALDSWGADDWVLAIPPSNGQLQPQVRPCDRACACS